MLVHQRVVNYDELLIGGFKHEWMIFHFIYWGCHPNPIDELMNHHLLRWFFHAPPTRLLLTIITHINNHHH